MPTPFVTAGSLNLTARGGGSITLVAPTIVEVNLRGTLPDRTLAIATRLTLHFVPEPGTLALLGAGLVALAVARRRR